MTGRPVDIEIVPKAHALLSASSAERWLVCTPSARVEEALEDGESAYATDGTAAHAFAELRLRYKLGQTTKAEYHAAYDATKALFEEQVEVWDPSDWDAINSYVEYVLDEHARLGGSIEIEARVDYSEYAQGGFGTSDALLISAGEKVIKSIDLKFGKGVPVYATGNPQARLYALGGFLSLSESWQEGIVKEGDWKAEYTIHQPRLNSVTTGEESLGELLTWARTVVAPAAKLAWEGKGPLTPTDKGCRFCKAASRCRARIAENVLIARRDFDMSATDDTQPDFARLDDRLMDMEEVARILPYIDGWLSWANRFKEYAASAAARGETIEGYKLVRGRQTRQWAAPPAEIAAALAALGVSETTIFTPPAEPTVRSVAQMEKAMGAKQYRELEVEEKFVTKSTGSPTLVPATDPRPAIDAAAEARASFES